jgi:Cys-rich repeat protein
MNGQVCVQCRFDVDCTSAGTYCLSGNCVPCTHDRHCGKFCQACGASLSITPNPQDPMNPTVVSSVSGTPFCDAPNGDPSSATCVQCLTDANCGTGAVCDPSLHTCSNQMPCSEPCAPGQFCSGGSCVQCITSSQCPCGQCVDGICTSNCGDTSDCRSNQCCQQMTGTCMDERCVSGPHAGTGLCCEAAPAALAATSEPDAPPWTTRPLWAVLAALGLLLALRQRSLGMRLRKSGGHS